MPRSRIRTRMRIPAAVLTLLSVLVLFVAGCSGGGEEGKAPEESSTEVAEATAPEGSRAPVLNITNSDGEQVGVEVEIAADPASQEKGLMDRTELAEDAGMLFVFERERSLSFWMKNTLIPLSIAYIDSGGRIVDIQDMQPQDETPHPSAKPAQYALEVNQGFFGDHNVEVGDRVELPRRSSSVGTPRADHVIQAFRNAGLEVGETYPVELEPGWNERPVPKSYEEATRFTVPSLGENAGGRVFVFSTDEDLAALRDYYNGLKSSQRPHVYVGDKVLLQINRQMPGDEAEKYAEVLSGSEAPQTEEPPAGAPPTDEAPPVDTPPSEAPADGAPVDDAPAVDGPPTDAPPPEELPSPPADVLPGDVPPDDAPPVGAPG